MQPTVIPRTATQNSLIALLLAASGLIAVTSFATPARAADIDPAIDQACHGTLGFSRSTIEYQDCVRENAKAKVDAVRQAETEQAWQVCSQQGLQPGTSAYAMCVLQRQQPATTGFEQQAMTEKQACAQEGFTPGTDAFQTCFLNLDMTIHDRELSKS
jgi:hypothetical protein